MVSFFKEKFDFLTLTVKFYHKMQLINGDNMEYVCITRGVCMGQSNKAVLSEIQHRERILRERREKYSIAQLLLYSVFLFVGLILFITSQASTTLPQATPYGSILLANDAGGYVLTAILAFMAGVITTVLCSRYKNQWKNINTIIGG